MDQCGELQFLSKNFHYDVVNFALTSTSNKLRKAEDESNCSKYEDLDVEAENS